MSQNELKLRRGFQALVEVLSNSGRKSDQKASLVLPYQRDPGVCQNVQHAFKWGCSDACCRTAPGRVLIGRKSVSPTITPTGLFAELTKLGWIDVTLSDYGKQSMEEIKTNSLDRSFVEMTYFGAIAQLKMVRRMIALKGQTDVLAALLNKMSSDMDAATEKLLDQLDVPKPKTELGQEPEP